MTYTLCFRYCEARSGGDGDRQQSHAHREPKGGSIPIIPLFEQTFKAPVLLLGFGLPGSNLHAPNEWIDLATYHQGIETIARFYDEVKERMR